MMNNYSSNKYVFSPQHRNGNGGLFIVIPNPSHTGNRVSGLLKPLTALFHKFCPV